MKNICKILFFVVLLFLGFMMVQIIMVEKLFNVIYIMVDDLGIGDLGCYGQCQIKILNIDGIVQNGMKFMQYYFGFMVSVLFCCVLIIGKYMGYVVIRGNVKVVGLDGLLYEILFFVGEVIVVDIFKIKNYVIGCVGKWGMGGLGMEGMFGKYGFDYFYGYLG